VDELVQIARAHQREHHKNADEPSGKEEWVYGSRSPFIHKYVSSRSSGASSTLSSVVEPGNPMFIYCVAFSVPEMTDVNVQNNMKQGLLHVLAKKKGSPITEKDENGVIGDGHGGVFKWLLERGLDPLAEDMEMRTCLNLAAGSGSERILRILRRFRREK
jgi:hypothetical protein